MSGADVFRPPDSHERVAVRIERTLKFVSRELMPAERALGGQTLAEAGIDPDTPIGVAAAMMVRSWAASRDGVMGYAAQWGMLEKEILVINHVRVFVDGALVYEEELI